MVLSRLSFDADLFYGHIWTLHYMVMCYKADLAIQNPCNFFPRRRYSLITMDLINKASQYIQQMFSDDLLPAEAVQCGFTSFPI